jgi:hypothetical protein
LQPVKPNKDAVLEADVALLKSLLQTSLQHILPAEACGTAGPQFPDSLPLSSLEQLYASIWEGCKQPGAPSMQSIISGVAAAYGQPVTVVQVCWRAVHVLAYASVHAWLCQCTHGCVSTNACVAVSAPAACIRHSCALGGCDSYCSHACTRRSSRSTMRNAICKQIVLPHACNGAVAGTGSASGDYGDGKV